MKKLITFILIAGVALSSCQSNNSTKTTKEIISEATAEPETKTNEEPKTNWEYSQEVDKMSGDTNYFARIYANETFRFQEPYGTVTINLLLRNKAGVNDILLMISEGQFLSNIGDDRSIGVRFDSSKAFRVGYLNPSDYSSTSIFIQNEKKIIAGLKKADKTIIQSEFYNEGNVNIEFDTKGLVWNH